MTKPVATTHGAVLDPLAADREMREEPAYARDGHTARTLVREPDLRIVLIVMKAGSRIDEHEAEDTASIHVLSGHIRLLLPERTVHVPAGQLLVLARGLRHAVEAASDSAFLLTLGWKPKG